MHLFAVSDGHGQNGHKASGYIKDALTTHLVKFFSKDKDFVTDIPQFQSRLPSYLHKTFM
jgi:serine/threonine protein phosphatase PrpC